MIQISFNFQDAAEVQAFLNRVLDPVQEALAPQDHTPATPESTPAAAPKPRGRPRKEAVASAPDTAPAAIPSASPAVQAPASVDAAASVSSEKAVTIDDVRKTAEEVVAKLGNEVGMTKAREIIRHVGGVVTIRDIPADKMAAVNAELRKLL